ncbi:MAG: hypothetical protein OSJ58_11870 [Dysosmobacter sp.]|uniref:hypothetical protein n=1 Tax=uncultured Oscillibacter sp. TaxID=876091 RepID=UPI0026150F4A|nr:hypothetical protein [uncultured Oscillibacter sp.]MCX4372499.1 hypothetical protein [Dysosmobacter sp.]
MVIPLSNRTGAPVKWGQSAKTQKVGKRTAESAMTDGFVEQIKKHAKEDARRGVYMSPEFNQMRLAHMKQCVSPDRSGPKAEVMSAIRAALNEPHPLLQALDKMLEKLSGGGSANLKISGIQQTAEVYAPNGENIASYNSLGGGWTDIQTREEHKFLDESTFAYLQAYREARAEMKAEAPAVESAASFDTRI